MYNRRRAGWCLTQSSVQSAQPRALLYAYKSLAPVGNNSFFTVANIKKIPFLAHILSPRPKNIFFHLVNHQVTFRGGGLIEGAVQSAASLMNIHFSAYLQIGSYSHLLAAAGNQSKHLPQSCLTSLTLPRNQGCSNSPPKINDGDCYPEKNYLCVACLGRQVRESCVSVTYRDFAVIEDIAKMHSLAEYSGEIWTVIFHAQNSIILLFDLYETRLSEYKNLNVKQTAEPVVYIGLGLGR